MLTRLDIQVFEYIHHLFYENKLEEELFFNDHISNDYQLDEWASSYYKIIWEKQKNLFTDKCVLDIGCNFGSKINWFKSVGVKQYTGIDPAEKNIYYANIVKKLVSMPCNLYQTKAEDFAYDVYDTGCLLSVTHHLEDVEKVFNLLTTNCTNVIVDTWVDSHGCKSLSYYIELLEKNNHELLLVDKIKNSRYVIISSSKAKNQKNFWSL